MLWDNFFPQKLWNKLIAKWLTRHKSVLIKASLGFQSCSLFKIVFMKSFEIFLLFALAVSFKI